VYRQSADYNSSVY